MKTGLSAPQFNTEKIKKIPLKMASHAFLIILLSILVYLALGAALFYQYAVVTDMQPAQVTQTYVTFENSQYQNILKTWQSRQQNLQQFTTQTHVNPFITTSNK